MSEEATKKKRTRRVFGRQRRTIDGKDFIFEMTPFGVSIRELHKRSDPEILSFVDAYHAAVGQLNLLIE